MFSTKSVYITVPHESHNTSINNSNSINSDGFGFERQF